MDVLKLFLSYKFRSDEETFVSEIFYILRKQPGIDVFYWDHAAQSGNFNEQLKNMINDCDFFLFFWGEMIGKTQKDEARFALNNQKNIIPVLLPNRFTSKPLEDIPDSLEELLDKLEKKTSVSVSNLDPEHRHEESLECAKRILKIAGKIWIPEDGLPIGYPFQYEKDIIKEFIEGDGKLSLDRVREGCPRTWPKVDRRQAERENPIKNDIGGFRDQDSEDSQVIPVALADYHMNELEKRRCLASLELTFPEAGPRKSLYYPKPRQREMNVGILVSGGIAPGINSVISGIVKRHVLYHKNVLEHKDQTDPYNSLNIYAYQEGFKSLMKNFDGPERKKLYASNDSTKKSDEWIKETIYSKSDRGGSIIPTSRADDLLDQKNRKAHFEAIVSKLSDIDILYIVGGDGSMKAAHAISNYAAQSKRKLAVVTIPATMDNDILWVWQSFGFLSAVEYSRSVIRQIYTEVTSNPRVSIIQLFGSDSGFVAAHAALASGVCDLVLIPEQAYRSDRVVDFIIEKILKPRFIAGTDGRSPYGIILLAEAAIPTDALNSEIIKTAELLDKEIDAIKTYIENDCRVKGQTPDVLRSASLKILTKMLRHRLDRETDSYWKNFRVLINEPRHLIRSVPPSLSDIIIGERLGSLAVDAAMAGYRDFMISQWLTEYVLVPLKLVVLGRKRIPKGGIFWQSVRANTGQPSDLC